MAKWAIFQRKNYFFSINSETRQREETNCLTASRNVNSDRAHAKCHLSVDMEPSMCYVTLQLLLKFKATMYKGIKELLKFGGRCLTKASFLILLSGSSNFAILSDQGHCPSVTVALEPRDLISGWRRTALSTHTLAIPRSPVVRRTLVCSWPPR